MINIMPYKVDTDSIKLSDTQDRRRKITDEQRDEIRTLYANGHSIRSIARQYCVYPRTISIICKPETRAALREYTKEHWREFQQPKERRTAAIRETRRYRQRVLNDTPDSAEYSNTIEDSTLYSNTIPDKVNK